MEDPLAPSLPSASLPDPTTFRRDLRRVTLAPLAVLGLAVLGLVALVLFLLQSARSVERLDARIGQVVHVQRLAVDMETGVRGFQLTGDTRFLQPWDQSLPLLAELLRELEGPVAKSAVATLEGKQLAARFHAWEDWAQQAIQLRNEGLPSGDVNFELNGKALMDELRASAHRLMQALELERRNRVDQLRYLETSVLVVLGMGGLLLATVAIAWLRRVVRQISGAYRKSLQASASQTEELQVLLRSIGDAVVTTDQNSRVVFFNAIAEKLTGWSAQEARGKALDDVFVISNETTGERALNPADRALKEGIIVGLANHTVLTSRTGEQWPIEDSAAPIRGADGRVRGVILVFHDVSERRQQERAVQVSEERYRRVFNLQFQFMTILSPDGRILEVNDLPLRVAECRREEVIGMYFADAPWWKDLPEMKQAWPQRLAQAASQDEPLITVDHYRTTKGEVRSADTALTAVKDEDGAVRFFILQASDSTERLKAEQTLRENERRFRFLNDLVEATRGMAQPAAIMEVVARVTGRYLKVSRCAYAEVEEDEEHFTILHDYTNGCASSVGRYGLTPFGTYSSGKMRAGQVLVLHDVNRELPQEDGGQKGFAAIGVEAIICCPLMKEGKLRAMMAVHQAEPRTWTLEEVALVEEVVERSWAYIEQARTSAALQVREEETRLALSAAAMGTWHYLPQKGELRWDERTRELFGLPPNAKIDFSVFRAGVHRDDLPRVEAEIVRAFDPAGSGTFESEYRTIGLEDGGQERWVRSTGQSYFDGQPVVQRFIGTLQDVTSRKQAEESMRLAREQAESASRAKDNFLAALSHELRTPLTPVLLTAAALRADSRLPRDVQGDLATLQRNVELEARLIDDLLDLTRIARGKLSMREQDCDVHSLIGLAVEIVREEARAKEQSIQLELQAQRTLLRADPARLQQLFWNLLRNAVKFTPTGGQIFVRTKDGEDGFEAEVTDTGIGLEADVFERIFQPFEQVGFENDHRFGGLGLGLAIARAIVELHHGQIQAQSNGRGKGATFMVQLPQATRVTAEMTAGLESAPPASSAEKASVPVRPSFAPMRLLVVEDNAPTLEVLVRLLRRAGHTITPAPDVRSALAAAAEMTFDGVVSDLGLPDGTGISLMHELREKYGLRGIALSGYGMDEDLRRTREAGFATHLVKPIDFETLQQALTLLRPSSAEAPEFPAP